MIALPTGLYNVIRQLLNSRLFDAKDLRQIESVAWYLDSVKETEAADWVRVNYVTYLQGLLEGFEVDNSQKQGLKDIHTEDFHRKINK